MLHWELSDHLGSTSTTANQDGSFSSTIQYTAFGEIRVTKNTTLTKYRYTGQLAQAELGLDYYVARWYDPVLGHFTQADTIIPEPGKASAFDRYAYTLNNPVKFNDPTGHDVGCAGRDASECQGGINKLSNKQIQQKVFEKHVQLVEEIRLGKYNDLQALAQLSDYAASYTPKDPMSFSNNMGAILTGHAQGYSANNEILIKAKNPNVQYEEYYESIVKSNTELMQSGYAIGFQDPGKGGNQAHHFWFYVQVGIESGFPVAIIGNALHETILSNPGGKSYQDYALGVEGAVLGQGLGLGIIKPQDTGDYLLTILSPSSISSQYWTNPTSVINVP